jgi:hypothetical protein
MAPYHGRKNLSPMEATAGRTLPVYRFVPVSRKMGSRAYYQSPFGDPFTMVASMRGVT